MSIKEVERAEIGGARGAVGIYNGSYMGKVYRGSRGDSSRSENKVLELVGEEQRETVVIVIG